VKGAPAPLVGILLAAGGATRYGADKLLTLLPSGEPLAVAAAHHLREGLGSGARLLAALRPEQIELGERLAASGFELVVSDEARAGMGRSLALAVAASPDASGWLVALADMPAIQPATIARVAAALAAGASVAAPFHAGRRGHPVGLAATWRAALMHLDGDIGARELLREAGDTPLRIETDDPGVLLDIDTPDDFAMLQVTVHSQTTIY
jgi:molybdenum cofactor cytidylyltransferase